MIGSDRHSLLSKLTIKTSRTFKYKDREEVDLEPKEAESSETSSDDDEYARTGQRNVSINDNDEQRNSYDHRDSWPDISSPV